MAEGGPLAEDEDAGLERRVEGQPFDGCQGGAEELEVVGDGGGGSLVGAAGQGEVGGLEAAPPAASRALRLTENVQTSARGVSRRADSLESRCSGVLQTLAREGEMHTEIRLMARRSSCRLRRVERCAGPA